MKGVNYISIVLCGGFAKRMWPLTKNRPKQLLPVAGQPMLIYTLERLNRLPQLKKIYLSVNSAFQDHFREFLQDYSPRVGIDIIIEPTRSEEEKLGAVKGLDYALEKVGRDNPAIIVGGDNLFEFPVERPVELYERTGRDVIAVYDLRERERARLYGVVEVDKEGVIKNFIEKPEDPPSTLVATAFYIFTPSTLKDVRRYLEEGGRRDALGHFLEWLIKRKPVQAYTVEGEWFDIGSFESLSAAERYFARPTD
ncbi:MAG: nucleotidyltransferase family protein [Thermoplasmata archaeon]|nr:nucleotidyltransferase family protein [Thermoplasmata archaeon]